MELLVNGGFEESDGTGAPMGWTNGGGGTVWRCSASGNPMDGDSVPRSGDWMACFDRDHKSSSDYFVYQDIDVSSYATGIDSSAVFVNATGYLVSDQAPDYDDVYLQIRFLDAQKNEISDSRYDSGEQRPET